MINKLQFLRLYLMISQQRISIQKVTVGYLLYKFKGKVIDNPFFLKISISSKIINTVLVAKLQKILKSKLQL